MGKGFNNYMCKKFFHPASRDNLKRVWMAEQKSEAYKKKQEELRQQYEKEQDLHDNKAMLSKESKDKLSINFMYEPPPGVKKEREREDNEPEYKFEWQRKYNAPRESYCKGDQEIRDQPFGIQVRNVRCIKCHKWGHINTDKECPMYSLSMSAARSLEAGPVLDQNSLVAQMLEDGLAIKKQHLNVSEMNKSKLITDDECNDEAAFLKSLTTKQKKALLKKLEKIEKRERKKLKQEEKEESSGDSDDSGEERRQKGNKIKKRRDESEGEGRNGFNKRENGNNSWRNGGDDKYRNGKVDNYKREGGYFNKDKREDYRRNDDNNYKRNDDNNYKRNEDNNYKRNEDNNYKRHEENGRDRNEKYSEKRQDRKRRSDDYEDSYKLKSKQSKYHS